ncbi:intracellular protein transport protein [Cryomyces antarcticus]
MLRMLEAQAPAKQNATDAINTLSGRLNNATLLEDRRGAILGLRSFAKEYPASVASGALRGLIESLKKDAEDVDTIKIVLETLLMLFNPNERSPEASEDIPLWLADLFTQRQDNITILLDFVETNDFYSRLYSIQLISAISTARPERTQECILSAPLGTTRLVAVLDDLRDAVRDAGIVLLTDLTRDATELQKLVAFENAFDRIFNIIKAEGGLTQGGITIQDCLSLLANLLRNNHSNQSLFRENGTVRKLYDLLPGSTRNRTAAKDDDEFPNTQKNKNLWGLLAILRMFLVKGSVGTKANQDAFQRYGILQQVLNLAFENSTEVATKAEALYTCADTIRGNAKLQEGFAQLQVAAVTRNEPTVHGETARSDGPQTVYIIDGLLDLVLGVASNQMFDARAAACECIKAYFYNHTQIRVHFLRRAIEGHTTGEDETANVISTLIKGPLPDETPDAYRRWFASVLVMHLIHDDREAKDLLMAVAEGDAESGEEVVTCIQAIAGNLTAGIRNGEDERVLVGYLMLLCSWLYEDADAVNDLLGEGSTVQSLAQAASRPSMDQPLIPGLCAVLLGILYDFSTKDSPISRRTLQPILISRLGRERYLDAIIHLRQHPHVRDFEVLPQNSSSAPIGALPNVFFDPLFVDFLKDNFSRLMRAVDRDPGFESLPQSLQSVDRDLLDDLRTQLESRTQALQRAEAELLTKEKQLNQEQADHRRYQETAAAVQNKIKSVNEALQRDHESEIQKIHAANRAATEYMQDQHERSLGSVRAQLEATKAFMQEGSQANSVTIAKLSENNASIKAAYDELDGAHKSLIEEASRLESEIEGLEKANEELKTTVADLRKEVLAREEASTSLNSKISNLESDLRKGTERIVELEAAKEEQKKANELVAKKEEELRMTEEARSAAQTELDDMLMVLADLEEKRARDKRRLKELGEETSDVEEDGEEVEDGDEADEAGDEEEEA